MRRFCVHSKRLPLLRLPSVLLNQKLDVDLPLFTSLPEDFFLLLDLDERVVLSDELGDAESFDLVARDSLMTHLKMCLRPIQRDCCRCSRNKNAGRLSHGPRQLIIMVAVIMPMMQNIDKFAVKRAHGA